MWVVTCMLLQIIGNSVTAIVEQLLFKSTELLSVWIWNDQLAITKVLAIDQSIALNTILIVCFVTS